VVVIQEWLGVEVGTTIKKDYNRKDGSVQLVVKE
jgi:hypothetical protein